MPEARPVTPEPIDPPFGLHEYGPPMAEFINVAIHELMRRKDPLYGNLSHRIVESVPTSRLTLDTGETIDSAPTPARAGLLLSGQGVIDGDFTELYVQLDDAATQMLEQVVPAIFAQLQSATDAVGSTIDLQGRPLTHEAVLEAFERMEFDVDEDGTPVGVSIYTGQGAFDAFQNLPPPTREQQRAWDDMIDRKRRQSDARRNRRRLS